MKSDREENKMKPVLVIPLHDPQGLVLPHLLATSEDIQRIFETAYISITSETQGMQPEGVRQLADIPFFHVLPVHDSQPIGSRWTYLYRQAAIASNPDQVLHLCFPDRLVFALESDFRAAFIGDVLSVEAEHTPLLFQRSKTAWDTHPRNYYEMEHFLTVTGELTLGKALDFAWCHFAVTASYLRRILPLLKHHDSSMMVEFVLLMLGELHTKDVDWLCWEDPLIYGIDAQTLKAEREASIPETRKRLGYVLPMVQTILAFAEKQ
jgi:hypothetical protein